MTVQPNDNHSIHNKIPEVYMQQGGISPTKINIRGIEAKTRWFHRWLRS